MKLLVINPNTTTSMTDKIGHAARAAAGAATELVALQPPDGPESIEGYYDEAFSVPGILSLIAGAERAGPADAYVIAVGHLADRLRGAGPILAPWPRDERALSFEERVALQKRLTSAGFDTGGVDAKMGPKTVAAIKTFQKARGMVPDGFPSLSVLQALQ